MLKKLQHFFFSNLNIIKVSTLLLVLFFIGNRLIKQKVTLLNFYGLLQDISLGRIAVFGSAVLFLMLVNWLLEAYKWKVAVEVFEPISFNQAIKSILIGLALGTFSPLMSGDFLGRLNGISDKKKALIGNAFCSGMQTLTSMVLGFGSLLFLFYQAEFMEYKWPILIAILVLFPVLLIAFFIILFPEKIKRFKWATTFLKRFLLSKLFIISIVRNLLFSLQFIILLYFFNIDLSFLTLFWGTHIIFLIKTVAGGVHVLGDLLVRQLSSVTFFAYYNISPEPIILATLVLWLINILVPVIFGLYFFLKVKKQ